MTLAGVRVGIPVFVSHSSHTDVAKARVRALARAMREKCGLIPLLDKEDLTGGTDWKSWIANNLMGSRAGVVLLTRSALNSPRVWREVSFMEFASRAYSRYVFLPVVMPEIADLKVEIQASTHPAIWSRLDLDDLHYVHGNPEPEALARTIAEQLSARDLMPYLPPIELLADQVGELLRDAPPTALEAVVSGLGTAEYSLYSDLRQRAGTALTHAAVVDRLVRRPLRALDYLGARFPDSHRFDVVESLAPLVLQVDAAIPLKDPRMRAYRLVADDAAYVVSKLIELADLSCKPPRFLAVPNSLGTAKGVRDELREAALSTLSPELVERYRPELDDWIDRSFVYIVLPGRLDPIELADFHAIYPNVNVVMVSPHGAILDGDEPLLEPTSGAHEEHALRRDYDDACTELDWRTGL